MIYTDGVYLRLLDAMIVMIWQGVFSRLGDTDITKVVTQEIQEFQKDI